MVVMVMMLGLLGMDMLGGTGKVVLSMFPVYMIAYVLLVSWHSLCCLPCS